MKVNVKKALALSDYNGRFKDSLKLVLKKLNNTDLTLQEKAYLLATAKIESEYSLQRWEADYLCGEMGVAYSEKPCQKAINYYRSSSGKKNYFDLGTDKKGMAYFGRGLIQLTGKDNYAKYGKKINVDLVNDGDKALKKNNSFNIAVAYMKDRTFKHLPNDLHSARQSVGNTQDRAKVDNAYYKWLGILKTSEYEPIADKIPIIKNIEPKKRKALLVISSVSIFAGIGAYFLLRKK